LFEEGDDDLFVFVVVFSVLLDAEGVEMEEKAAKEVGGDGIQDALAGEVGAEFHEVEFADEGVRADLFLAREVFVG
jgi:hypothetical protein